MTQPTTTPARGDAGQTFLVGPTLYLRGLEPDDGKRINAWNGSLFPFSAARAEETLKEATSGEADSASVRLVACRRDDDAVVGSAAVKFFSRRAARVSFATAPGLGALGAEIVAEQLTLIVPWLIDERQCMVAWCDVDAQAVPVVAAAESLGMRQASRLREALWIDGARHDWLTYEALHPAWIERLGDPGPGIAEASEPRIGNPPAPLPVPPSVPPHNALMVGNRVLLRTLEVEDAVQVARSFRQETETFFATGRHVLSAVMLSGFFREQGERVPPSNIEFGVVLRETGELIGDVGVYDVDWVHRTGETGSYLYRPEHRGGGLGTEAKQLLLAYAFDRLGLHMVRSTVWEPNTRSAAALRKQGYRDAGRLRWSGIDNGTYGSTGVFDLLADEWRRSRQ